MKKTKKNFKLTLDSWYNGTTWKHNIYGQRKRGYGSYLYTQDKERFNLMFDIWNVSDNKREFEERF